MDIFRRIGDLPQNLQTNKQSHIPVYKTVIKTLIKFLLFRWFKFTLKPPYSGASERSLLAIWTLPIGIFLSNLDSGQLETSLMTSYCHF